MPAVMAAEHFQAFSPYTWTWNSEDREIFWIPDNNLGNDGKVRCGARRITSDTCAHLSGDDILRINDITNEAASYLLGFRSRSFCRGYLAMIRGGE